MVGHSMTYGVMITDEFGNSLDKYKQIVSIVRELMEKEGEPDWIASFPSVENEQLVLGFHFEISKKTDFTKIDNKWKKLMEETPEKIKELMVNIEEPDVVMLSGSF